MKLPVSVHFKRVLKSLDQNFLYASTSKSENKLYSNDPINSDEIFHFSYWYYGLVNVGVHYNRDYNII